MFFSQVLKLMKADLKNQPFTYNFGKTMANQVKKQYDGYSTYFSAKNK